MKAKNLIVILQARCSSSRLPGKILKKICGIPIVLLCVKRLSNKGAKVIVATSNHKTDDKLEEILIKNKIDYFRGSLKNVLSRYQFLARRLNKSDYIIRATADNTFPDGNMVSMLLNHVKKLKTDYYGIDHKIHNLPKGFSLEIFTAKRILSLKHNLKKEDKEHVTLAIYKNKKKYSKPIPLKKLHIAKNFSNLNVSVDTKKDFKLVKKIFSRYKDPIKISYKSLLNFL